MGRRAIEEIPDHPAIIQELCTVSRYGRDYNAVQVVCPDCQALRAVPIVHIRAEMRRSSFTGRCRGCRKPSRTRSPGRHRSPDGMIMLTAEAMTDSEMLARFHQRLLPGMLGMLEQIWVMSELLGRPLYPHELVLHRNGQRRDNRPENLELVIQWKNGRKSEVLAELERARWLLKHYGAAEDALRAARAAVTPDQESAPQDDDRSGPSTAASTSSNVSPAE